MDPGDARLGPRPDLRTMPSCASYVSSPEDVRALDDPEGYDYVSTIPPAQSGRGGSFASSEVVPRELGGYRDRDLTQYYRKDHRDIDRGEIHETYEIGQKVFLKGARLIDPEPYHIHRLFGNVQCQLSRDGKCDGRIYPLEYLASSPGFKSKERIHDFTQDPEYKSLPQSSQRKVDVDSSGRSPDETTTGVIAKAQAEKVSKVTEKSIEFDDTETWDPAISETELRLPENSEGEVFEEASAKGNQQIPQLSPKKSEGWTTRTMLSIFGLGERPLRKGKSRVYWRCGCGRDMYDDFIELQSGAAAELEKWLNDSMRNHAGSGLSNPPLNANLRSTASPSANDSAYQPTAESDISLQRLAATASTRPGSNGNAAIALDVHLEKCWLLVCGKAKRGPDSLLAQLDLSSTPSDKQLFDDIREAYSHLRKKWTLRSFLRGVKTIRFVQFELHKSSRVDIRKVPDMPPESRRDEYLYEPCDLIPPVGEVFMTHWFQHPQEAWELPYALSLFPKKRKGEIEINLNRGPRVAWGIQLIEGWMGSRIWLLSLSLFVCGSLAFAICWTLLKHDIQGAFGVSAYIIALLTLVVGATQTNLR